MLEVAGVVRGIERLCLHLFLRHGGSPNIKYNIRAVGKPSAGFLEVLVQGVHHEVDGAAVGIADEATEGVATDVVGETGVMVVVEWAETLVTCDAKAKALGNEFYGEGAEFFYFVFFHNL